MINPLKVTGNVCFNIATIRFFHEQNLRVPYDFQNKEGLFH